ncbi:MAG: 30S ribosomal protein S12 methylthiotransferase RimO [Oscillospiraceae bacterium]|nr:30S ribosomal protein S12 methylthiotransferase RimO [Oscillospiraceae bacterium]
MASNKISVGLISLGCPKNQVDAERILAILKNKNFEISTSYDYCDIIIINTCAFIESAKQESINEILSVCDLKNINKKLKLIVVTGCLAQRYKEELKLLIPEVDIVVGLGANKDIANLILKGLEGDKRLSFPPEDEMMICGERVLTTPSHFAYLKIADGCNNRCTYCAIPMIRGNYRSVPMELLIKEAQELAGRGVKELNIVAQDVTYYGFDLYKKLALPELLKKLSEISGIEWIRLLYCYPDKITDELIEEIASNNKIVKYIDIPFQHVNNEMLKKMRRKGDKKVILDVISKLRKKIPDIVIRSTFIVGFPGETQEQFEELLEFVKDIKLNRLGCFKYSQEENTPAASFENQISQEIKDKRYEAILEAQDQVVFELHEKQKNKKYKVLVEGYDEKSNIYYGRTYMDAPEIDEYVEFDLGEDYDYDQELPKPGDFLDIVL